MWLFAYQASVSHRIYLIAITQSTQLYCFFYDSTTILSGSVCRIVKQIARVINLEIKNRLHNIGKYFRKSQLFEQKLLNSTLSVVVIRYLVWFRFRNMCANITTKDETKNRERIATNFGVSSQSMQTLNAVDTFDWHRALRLATTDRIIIALVIKEPYT